MARNSSEHKISRKMLKTLNKLSKENPDLKFERNKKKNAFTIKDSKQNIFNGHCGKSYHHMRRWLHNTNNDTSFRVC